MLTKNLWENSVYYKFFASPIDYLLALLGSLITLPLDIILSPFELIGLVLYKIFEK